MSTAPTNKEDVALLEDASEGGSDKGISFRPDQPNLHLATKEQLMTPMLLEWQQGSQRELPPKGDLRPHTKMPKNTKPGSIAYSKKASHLMKITT